MLHMCIWSSLCLQMPWQDLLLGWYATDRVLTTISFSYFFSLFFPVKYHTSKYTSRGFETLRDLTRCPVNSETPLIVSSFSSKLWPHQHDCTTHRSIACARTIRSQDRVISSKTLDGQRRPIVAELLWSSLDHSVVDDKYQRHGSIVENRVLFYYEDVLSVVWEILHVNWNVLCCFRFTVVLFRSLINEYSKSLSTY